MQTPELTAVSQLAATKVKNLENESLGEIKDVVIDIVSGRVAFAILSFGGFMGFGEKVFAMPWEAFKWDSTDRFLRLNVARTTLQNAPGFDKSQWPAATDSKFLKNIYGHYGFKPYWDTEDPMQDSRSSTSEMSPQDGQNAANQTKINADAASQKANLGIMGTMKTD